MNKTQVINFYYRFKEQALKICERLYRLSKREPFLIIYPLVVTVVLPFLGTSGPHTMIAMLMGVTASLSGLVGALHGEQAQEWENLHENTMKLCQNQSDLIQKQRILLKALVTFSQNHQQQLEAIRFHLANNQTGHASVMMEEVSKKHQDFYNELQ